jgi:hypothetical protein
MRHVYSDIIDKAPGLCDFLEAWDNDELPDGAWWAMLMEGVEAYNDEYDGDIDPHDGVLAYVYERGE